MNNHTQEMVSGAMAAFILRVGGAALSFASNLLLARLLGADGAGVYYLALTVTGIAAIVGRVGLDNAVLKFAAQSASQSDWNSIRGLYRKSLVICTAASLVTTLLVLLGSQWIATEVFRERSLAAPLRIIALSIVPTSLVALHASLLQGLKHISASVIVQITGFNLLTLILLGILGSLFGTIGAAASVTVATVLIFFVSIVLWHRATPQLKGLTGEFDVSLLIRTSIPLFWVALLNIVMSTMSDKVVLGIFTSPSVVAIYNVASLTAGLTAFILLALNTSLAPKFAELHGNGSYQELGDIVRSGARIGVLVSLPIVALFVIVPSHILGIFGPEFMQGAPFLTILSIGQFINVAVGTTGNLLIMTGYEKAARDNILWSTILNVMLLGILVPTLGALGAAIATSFAFIIKGLHGAFLVNKHLSIRIW